MSDRKHQPIRPHLGRRCGPTGKIRFKSHAGAFNRAMEIASTPACNAEILRVYQCQFCGGFHLSSKPVK